MACHYRLLIKMINGPRRALKEAGFRIHVY